MKLPKLLCVFLALGIQNTWSQTTFYDLDSIQTIEVYFSQTNWDYQMDTAKLGADSYIMADQVKINGIAYDSVGVKYKGNSSFDSTYVKNPLHIALDEFKDQSHQGVEDVKLGNGYADPSMVREVLAYQILRNYMHSPRSNFAKLYINNKYIGLYSNDENIDKQFCSTHFHSSKHTFVKGNPTVKPSPTTKSNLRHLGADSTIYGKYYELKSDAGWNELVNLCDTVTNQPSAIDKVLNIDRVLWMLAFNNVTANLDSYSGVFAQNYYLYRDKTKHFNPIVWDLNMAFGGFPYLGSGNTSMASLSIANLQQLPLNIHSNDAYWPLIKAVMSNSQYQRMYTAHARTIVNEFFSNKAYESLFGTLQGQISEAVKSDSNKFFTFEQFGASLNTNTSFSSYAIPGLKTLMDARVSYLQATPEFTANPPLIAYVKCSELYPKLDSNVTILAKLSNASTVYLNYRYDQEDTFSQTIMHDDGLHQDSLAGDGIFAAAFPMVNNTAQYYVYAENSTAGTFIPQRAAHEFFTIEAQTEELKAGDVVINEFLAVNQLYGVDETGKREDWIELYNTSSHTINLFGHHLSDSKTNLSKYTFPKNSIIQGQSYLMLWADEDASTSSYLHCNFKLASSGESLYLSTAQGNSIDSVVFGTQTADISMGRCPDGTGQFIILTHPTFKYANDCLVDVRDATEVSKIIVSPNPAQETLHISRSQNSSSTTRAFIYNTLGETVLDAAIDHTLSCNINNWPNGLYILKIDHMSYKIIIAH